MSEKYPNLNKPLKIGSVTIKNRYIMAPMDTGPTFLGPDGEFNENGIDYFVRRAQGGFGLLYSGGQQIDDVVDHNPKTILKNPAAYITAGQELNARISAYGAKMFLQLCFGLGRNIPGMHAPSELPVWLHPEMTSPALTKEQIQTKIDLFVQSAVVAKQAGFAGIDVHALHWGHLLDQFAMSITNHRTDEYGGSLENRLRVTREIVERVKAECGKDFPVTIRLSLRQFMKDFDKGSYTGEEEVGRTLEESVQIAKLLEEYGYDALSVDSGNLDAYYYACPPSYLKSGYMLDLVDAVKKEVSIPLLVGSRMDVPELAEQAIADGRMDAVVIGRPSIADPDYADKVLKGHEDKIRPCLACNQGCIHRYLTVGNVCCAVNPEMGRGITYRATPALKKKKIVIVGGGVAGMEAARTCAMRGHEVVLFEKSGQLGGNMIPAGKHEFKKEVRRLNEWYQAEIKSLPVEIHMNEEATPEKIKALGADAVILSVGSTAIIPKIPGVDLPNCMSCSEALAEQKTVGDKIVIVGGGLVGCEMALEYLQEGKQVTIVEALDHILSAGAPVPAQNVQMLGDAFEHYHAQILEGHRIVEVTPQGAVVEDKEGNKKTVEADSVIMSVGFRPLPSMKAELEDTDIEVYQVGDGRQVGSIMTAIWEAYEVAHSI